MTQIKASGRRDLRTSGPQDHRTSGPQDRKPRGPRPKTRGSETWIVPLDETDLPAVVRLDARLTGRRKPAYWKAIFGEFVAGDRSTSRIGLAARSGGQLSGYLLGEVRAFEFGSPPCGWIFAVGVNPEQAHHGIGSALVAEAGREFRRLGVSTVRTMVGRTDISMLAFFRSNGFAAGRFTQLELDLAPAARRT